MPTTQPAPPFPAQDLQKPGRESKMDPAPRFEAPEYRAAGKLKGQVALITDRYSVIEISFCFSWCPGGYFSSKKNRSAAGRHLNNRFLFNFGQSEFMTSTQ